jgi:hypothetical protein
MSPFLLLSVGRPRSRRPPCASAAPSPLDTRCASAGRNCPRLAARAEWCSCRRWGSCLCAGSAARCSVTTLPSRLRAGWVIATSSPPPRAADQGPGAAVGRADRPATCRRSSTPGPPWARTVASSAGDPFGSTMTVGTRSAAASTKQLQEIPLARPRPTEDRALAAELADGQVHAPGRRRVADAHAIGAVADAASSTHAVSSTPQVRSGG